MQTFTGRNPGGMSRQTRRIAIFAILLFGLSGLISGFAMGGFVRPKLPGVTGNSANETPPPIARNTATPSGSAQPQPVEINNYPSIGTYSALEFANNTSTYKFSAYLTGVVDKTGKPIDATDLTCKLWLIPFVAQNVKLVNIPLDRLQHVSSLATPITSDEKKNDGSTEPGAYPEIPGIMFSSSTGQVQPCSTFRPVTWQYKLSSSIHPDKYDLLVLFDWQGKHFNWSWVEVQIKGAEH